MTALGILSCMFISVSGVLVIYVGDRPWSDGSKPAKWLFTIMGCFIILFGVLLVPLVLGIIK